MKKQLLLLVMMLLSVVASADPVEIDGIYYNLITKGKVAEVARNPNNYSGSVIIPDKIIFEETEYLVTNIGLAAFEWSSELTSITIPNSVTTIANEAFWGCRSLTTIIIPNSVTSIGQYAFCECYGLTSIELPNNITSVTEGAFMNCTSLKSIIIPSSATSIGYKTFAGCSSLESITIPNSVTSIGKYAFLSCTGLSSITFPSSLTTIEEWAFWNCTGLTFVTFPNSVTTIRNFAFWECTGLTSITFGRGISFIGLKAFASCPELTDVYCYANNVPSTNSEAFSDSYIEYTTLHVPLSSIDSYSTREPWKNFKEIVKINLPKHALSYILDGETYKIYEIEEGETITPEPTPTKEGYTFSGWSEIPETMPAHDVTVTGSFSINKYKLTYTVDGEEYKSYEMEYGANITAESEPTKEGYTFSGWSEIPATMPAHDVTVTGTFSINSYKLTYIVDGEEYKTYDVEYGTTITPEAEPTKEGYTFSGWSEIPETMPAHDVTVTGTFSINTYKLNYIVDGEEYKSYELEYGATITPEPAPTKEGHTFSGWSEIPETMPAHDVTVISTFSINIYKLTYLVDGEEYKSYELEFGTAITPEAEPEKEGYTFSGWSEIPETMPAHDVTVIGTFSINSYKLTYVVDGQTYKTYDVEYGATITPEAEPTKEGYTFSGWSEIPKTMPAHDVTVTGSFSINSYKLTYLVDGEEYKSYELEFGAAITPEPAPEREGYIFSGWSEIPATMPAYDVTVTGTFSVNKYMLLYILDGLEYKTIEVEYGAVITPEPDPVKEGYVFSGWIGLPETMPAHNVTVTGTFSINAYKLTYVLDGQTYKTYDVEYGASITPEAEPTKEGYTFSGWDGLPETMPAHDVTVTGTFSINSYKLTYMIDDKVYKEVMYEYGATITPEPQPEGDYARFEWIGLPETMPAHDVTVYASYETGIFDIMTLQGIKAIYAPNGKKLDKLQKGLNIVVMQDGTVRKVLY